VKIICNDINNINNKIMWNNENINIINIININDNNNVIIIMKY